MNDSSAKENKILGRVMTGIVLAVTLVFDYFLVKCGMVPWKYLVPALILLLLPTVLVWAGTRRLLKRLCFALGTVLAVVTCGALIYGSSVLAKVTGTLTSITTVQTEVANVGVYVLAEDDAEAVSQLTEYAFGILSQIDRSSTDAAIEQFEAELDTDLGTIEYEGLTSLADALLTGECRVILLNSAFLEVLEEIEGYEDIFERIREVTLIEVVEEITVAAAPQEDTSQEQETSDEISENAFIVYISGIDSRNGLKAKSRSDVNILAVVNPDTHTVLLVSTPRDYYVPLSISNGICDKLTHAGIYGVSVSMDTLEMLYDIEVDYYVRICFEGLEEVVDALGGVTVYSEYSFQSSFDKNLYFTAGYNEMDGDAALKFSRERYAFASGDRQRGKNQMQVIKAIINKAMSPDILVKYNSLLEAAENNFETSVPYDLIASLVSDQLSSGADWNIVTYSVDGTGSSQVPYSMSVRAYVMIPDESTVATAQELMQAVLRGEEVEQP